MPDAAPRAGGRTLAHMQESATLRPRRLEWQAPRRDWMPRLEVSGKAGAPWTLGTAQRAQRNAMWPAAIDGSAKPLTAETPASVPLNHWPPRISAPGMLEEPEPGPPMHVRSLPKLAPQFVQPFAWSPQSSYLRLLRARPSETSQRQFNTAFG